MRALLPCLIGLALTRSVAAEPAGSASGALGAGSFGGSAATSIELGIDLAGIDYTVGFGGRLRWVAGDGLRTADWDEPSELASVIRYLVHARDLGGTRLSVAVGELGGVELGHGAVVGGYASGLNLDHGHLGAQVRAEGKRFGGELLIDDLIGPRIAAARGYGRIGPVDVGLTAAGDLSAPGAMGTELIPILAADATLEAEAPSGRLGARVYGDAVWIAGLGAGAHLGLGLDLRPRAGRLQIGLRVEARGASGGYVPGWFGPLYERDRRIAGPMGSRLDVARAGGLDGVGGAASGSIEVDGLGALEASYAQRPGLPRLIAGRVLLPERDPVQLGAWAAAEVGAGGEGRALAAEARVRLPRRLFARLEAARLYRDADGLPAPVTVLSVSVGAVLGE